LREYQIADKATRDGWFWKLGYLVAKYHAQYLHWNFTGDPFDCILQEFPEHYEMFMSVTPKRKDLYLYGSQNVLKFRSAQEFHPHLVWLMAGMPNSPGCECHYCAGTSMKELKQKYPLPSTEPPLPVVREPSSGPVMHQDNRTGHVDRTTYQTRNAIQTSTVRTKRSSRYNPY